MVPNHTNLHRASYLTFAVLLILLSVALAACGTTEKSESSSDESDASGNYAGKKVLFVNSYHAGYEWSDGIETGIHSVLDETGVEVKTVYMDTKRNTDEAFRIEAGKQAKSEIDAFEPDVILVADDNAQQFLVVPHLMEEDVPIVFMGVNWDASIYGYPTEHITGMIEVELVAELMDRLGEYADTERVGYVTITSETESKVIEEYNARFFDGQMEAYEASTFEEFKEAFLQAQDEMDVVLIGNNAGVEWDIEDAAQFFAEQTRVPTGSINSWMAQYTMITLAKIPEEQGEWSAQAALKILDGQSVSDIPVSENVKGELILNLDIAEQLGVVFQPSLLRVAEVVNSNGQGAQ